MALFISFLAGVILFYVFQYFPFSTSILSLTSIAVLIKKKKYLLIPVIAIGMFYAFFRYQPENDFTQIRGREIFASGEFVSEGVSTSNDKFMQAFHVESAFSSDMSSEEYSLSELAGEDISVISDDEFEAGKEYEVSLRILKDNTRLNPGMTGSIALYAVMNEAQELEENEPRPLSKGFLSIFYAFQNKRAELNHYITEIFHADSAALIASITTGQRLYMSEELRDAFNTTGLAHILSVSGTHFGIFSVFLFSILRFLIKSLPYNIFQRVSIYITASQAAALLCIPFMLAYLALSGWSVPAVRSFIMISLFLAGLLISRKGFWLNSLLFAAVIIVLWSPDALFSLSFQLSFLAVLFIGFSIGYGEKTEEKNTKKIHSTLSSALLLTFAATLGTAPLVAYHFHYFSLISPLTNLLITPFIGFVLLPVSLLSSFSFLVTGHFPLPWLSGTASDIAVWLVTFSASIPFADIKIPAFPAILVLLFYAGFVSYFFLNRKKYSLIIAFAPFIVYLAFCVMPRDKDISVTFLDAGQGDSSVITLPGNKMIVIDSGRTGKETASFLKYNGRKTIDALLLTHPHPDHSGGAEYLIQRFNVREIWDNGLDDSISIPETSIHRILSRGDTAEGKGYKIFALHPYREFYTASGSEYNEENNSSVVLKIQGARFSFLFTGDVEEEAEEDISHLSKWVKSNVIKIPHHGSRTSASPIFFDTVSPEIAVISVGRGNSFGHPHLETLEMLSNSKIYRTDRDGAIKITANGNELEIKTYKDFQFAKTKNLSGEVRNIKRLFEVW